MNSRDSEKILIEQGRCYLADMNPPRKSKPGKHRPVVVIQSSDTLRMGSPGVVIVPLTTRLDDANILRTRLSPSEKLKIEKPSDVLLDQIHTLDRSLLLRDLGPLNPTDFEKVERGVRFLLSF
ncbi:MAG: type II toxin-antitoxin system PemK/MazF family toxin [Deltaproteobacteria bacterium]|nr:type II toxin-antitoxin system PemK/MazF family toxin [Deltaproteobacteria bacterium]